MATTNTRTSARKAGDETRNFVNTAFDQLRTPLLAALGAGELTAQAVVDAMNKARTELNERTESAKALADDLPKDFGELRGKLDPAELRKLVDDYAQAAIDLYKYLVEHGEKAVDQVRAQPQVRKALEQVEEAVQAAQDRFEDVTGDAREIADDVLGRVTRRTRSVGEKAARATEQFAEQTAEAVSEAVTEAGEDLAHNTRSIARQAANRTDPKKNTPKNNGSATKNTKS